MKRTLFLILLAAVCYSTAAADVRSDFASDVRISANNYRAYPDQNLPKLTPAPEGYKPFYINHYGRHGSRWLITVGQYHHPIEQLEKGERNGCLTKRGREVLAALREVEAASQGRLGELSDIGAEQHQGIARRMVENFPEVFEGDARVDAKSTTVIRCILSMLNETDMLKSMNPRLRITTDASEHDMYYMNYHDSLLGKFRKANYPALEEFRDRHINPEHFLKTLFTDYQFALDSVTNPRQLMIQMLDVAGNMQSHHQFENVDLYDLFTPDDIYEVWNYNNTRWYILSGYTMLTCYRAVKAQTNLLESFLTSYDEAVRNGGNNVTLRFGHESVLLPLVCLMGINGYDFQTKDLEEVSANWQSYKVFPMAGNLQVVYYRKPMSEKVLVKILLNEHEASLPIVTDCYPYYDWRDVREFWYQRIKSLRQIEFPVPEL